MSLHSHFRTIHKGFRQMHKWGWQPMTWLPVWALLKEGSATKTPPWIPCALIHRVTSVKFSLVQARCSGKIPHPAPQGSRLLSQALANWIHLTYRCLWKSSKGLFQETRLVSHWIYRVKVLPAGAVWTKAGLSTKNKSHIGYRFLLVSALLSAYSNSLAGRRDWKLWRSKPPLWGQSFLKDQQVLILFSCPEDLVLHWTAFPEISSQK